MLEDVAVTAAEYALALHPVKTKILNDKLHRSDTEAQKHTQVLANNVENPAH